MLREVLKMNCLRTLLVGFCLLTVLNVSHAQSARIFAVMDFIAKADSTLTYEQRYSRRTCYFPKTQPRPDTLYLSNDSVRHHVELRTNLLYLATATPNLSVDFGLARRWSLSLTAGYNPFKYPARHREDDKTVNPKTLHWLVMPELKLWFRKHLEGGYVGLHGLYAEYNVGGISFIPALNNNRYDGNLYGGGLSFGWHWWLGRKHRTGLDLSIGAGYLRLHYDKYRACNCSGLLETVSENYFGPTKAAISFTYLIK